MCFPADESAWDKVVCDSYDLNKHTAIFDKDVHVNFFYRDKIHSYFSNAPYLETGGITGNLTDIPAPLLAKSIQQLLNNSQRSYLLLKSTVKLNLEPDQASLLDCYCTMRLSLDCSAQEYWRSYISAKVRNQVRKAQKQDFIIDVGGKEQFEDFYTVYAQCWRDLGTPVHAKRFFLNILDYFGDKTRIVNIYKNDVPISTAMLFFINETLHHPFAGTINTFKSTSVNNLLYWHLIKLAINEGVSVFDMGRSKYHSGTFRYKQSWGAKPMPLYYYYFTKPGVSPPDFDANFYRVATDIWKYMPLILANHLGPHLIKNIL